MKKTIISLSLVVLGMVHSVSHAVSMTLDHVSYDYETDDGYNSFVVALRDRVTSNNDEDIAMIIQGDEQTSRLSITFNRNSMRITSLNDFLLSANEQTYYVPTQRQLINRRTVNDSIAMLTQFYGAEKCRHYVESTTLQTAMRVLEFITSEATKFEDVQIAANGIFLSASDVVWQDYLGEILNWGVANVLAWNYRDANVFSDMPTRFYRDSSNALPHYVQISRSFVETAIDKNRIFSVVVGLCEN